MVRPLAPIDLVIAGPTASGKSRFAMAWALENGGEIVSADSRQIYREISVGTGKPSLSDREAVPHHMIDICSVHDVYSAGAFVRDARRAIEMIQSRGKKVVVCGGTGLYLKALLEGIVDISEGGNADSKAFRDSMDPFSTSDLYADLVKVDPERASMLAAGDRVRILRALFLYQVTGTPPTELYRRSRGESLSAHTFFAFSPGREELYASIGYRVAQMLSDGWIREVEELLAQGSDPGWPGFASLGYREVVAYLGGGIGMEELRETIVRKTRQYAKRQVTWFRHMDGATPVDPAKIHGFPWSLPQTMIKS